jgi:hypothetical protein
MDSEFVLRCSHEDMTIDIDDNDTNPSSLDDMSEFNVHYYVSDAPAL